MTATVTPIRAPGTSLYELTNAFLDVTNSLDDPDASLEDAVAQLAAIAGTIRDKGEAIACVTQDLERRAEVCKLEAKRLSERAKRAEAHVEWLKSYVLEQMKLMRIDHLDTSRFSLAIRQNPPKVEVLEEMLVPREFVKTVITSSVDKRGLLDHYRTTGEIPPGVDITKGERLDIR